MTLVALPVTREAWREIAAEIIARGQPERVDFVRGVIDLSDVALKNEPERKLAPKEK
jgi:hypothetical protein